MTQRGMSRSKPGTPRWLRTRGVQVRVALGRQAQPEAEPAEPGHAEDTDRPDPEPARPLTRPRG